MNQYPEPFTCPHGDFIVHLDECLECWEEHKLEVARDFEEDE